MGRLWIVPLWQSIPFLKNLHRPGKVQRSCGFERCEGMGERFRVALMGAALVAFLVVVAWALVSGVGSPEGSVLRR
jgi:hypothetical protein